jgi:Tol biopolymer transport system component
VAIAITMLVAAAPSLAAPAGSTVLVSRPDGFGPVPPAFDNDSNDPIALSQDGRYALFRSQADGFAPGVNPFAENLFVRDRVTGTTTLANRSDGFDGAGSNRDASDADLAVAMIGGQPHVLVVFSTFATNLVDHPTGAVLGEFGREHVWLRDVTAGETTLVSRADTATGAMANFGAGDPAIAIASSGPVVVFQSSATNLGATGSGGVFMRRMGVSDTELVSCRNKSCGGTPAAAFASSPDVATLAAAPGHPTCPAANHTECIFVAFATSDTTITEDPDARTQVMMAIAEPGVTATSFLVLSAPDQAFVPHANANATSPSFGGDGQAVAFLSSATNLTLDAMTPGIPEQAFLRIPGGAVSSDNRTFLLSKATGPANDIVYSVELGGTVTQPRAAFLSDATNLGATDRQAYVRDHAAGTTILLNRAPGAAGVLGNGFVAGFPRVSGDGSVAMFASISTNLGDGDPGRFTRVRTRKLTTPGQELELVSRPSGFEPFKSLTDDASGVATSADGRFVAFRSRSASLSDEDVDGSANVYVRDLATGSTLLVSRGPGPGGAPAAGFAQLGGISGDGRRVVFTATNLTPDSPPDALQVYVRDLDAQTTTLVSRANGPTGTPALGFAATAQISEDGRRVAFRSNSALDPAGADGKAHIYLRDLAAETTTIVDRDNGATGAVAPVDTDFLDLSGDGNRVAWGSMAAYVGAPADGRFHIFIRDLRAGTTTLASRAEGADGASANGDSRFPALNRAGDVVAFESRAQNLGETFVNGQIFVRDVAGAHTHLVSRASGAGVIAAAAGAPSIDAAGRRVSFGAAGDLDDTLSPQPPFANRIFVRDLPSSVTTLVSRGNGIAGAPSDGDSTFSSDITATGDCVAFQGASTNLDDGFASADFDAIHMRVLRNECPIPLPVAPSPATANPISAPGAKAAVLSRLSIKPSRFRVTGRRRGTTISFRLDKAARVTLTVERLLAGRRRQGRCRAKQRTGRKCTVARRAGRFAMNGRKGANTRKFRGVLARNRLPPGRYRLRAQPAGGKARTAQFEVLRAVKRRR